LKILEKILILVLLIMLVLPAIQKEHPFIKIRDLSGDFVLKQKPSFNWNDWFSGKFQITYDQYLEENIGFRNFLVRLINQLDYSIFKKTHAEGVVVGKENQLFEYDYIRAYIGRDFIGASIIDKKIKKIKFLQQYLKKETNTDLILVLEPGKASIYHELIPKRFLDTKRPNTNYDSFVAKAREHNIRFIDFNNYFKLLKERVDYPLYPKYGIHWSIYGMSFAADSLINYIEHIRQIDIPEVFIDSLMVKRYARRTDYDVGKTLNLLWRLPEKEPLAYPVYRFEDNPEKDKPMVLAVADSYYCNIFNTRIPKNLFKNQAFWYFYSKVYPDTYHKLKKVKDLDLKEEVEKQDVVFLMVTERFLYKFDWSFIDDVYSLYAPSSRYDIVQSFRNRILGNASWFNSIINKAEQKKESLEKMITRDAEYIFSQEDLETYLVYKGPKFYEEKIRSNDKWLSLTRKKAKERNVSLEQMISADAAYMFKQKQPNAYKTFQKIENHKQVILKDSLLLHQTKALAENYYMSFEEMLQIEAEKMANDP